MTRFLRHLIAPLITWLVAKGYLAAAFANDVTEVLVMIVAFVVAYVWSWWRERRRDVGQGGENA